MNIQKEKEELLKTRKGFTMKNTMTRAMALTTALTFVPSEQTEVHEILTKMIAQVSKPHKSSDEAKAKDKAKRTNARAALMEQVLPIVRESVAIGGTAKEIFERCADVLPADFTAAKVQYILLHEMANEVVKTEAKGKANTYRLIG